MLCWLLSLFFFSNLRENRSVPLTGQILYVLKSLGAQKLKIVVLGYALGAKDEKNEKLYPLPSRHLHSKRNYRHKDCNTVHKNNERHVQIKEGAQ